MKHVRFILTVLTIGLLVVLSSVAVSASAQDPQTQSQATAIMRGYRTGYSDGYQAGVNDLANHSSRDFRGKAEYDRADRAYNSSYGTFDDYRDGYQQGFETGYNAGFDGKPFDSSIPPELKRRSGDETVTNPSEPAQPANPPPQSGSGILIPRDTIMRIELLSNLSTNTSQKGDRFQARVIEPKEYDGATIEGQVTDVKRPGKAKGNSELQLSFDTIRLADGRSAKLNAQVIEVVSAGSDVGKVDPEGGVQGKDSTKNDVKKVGAATGIGAVIGAIAGGGIGAAVGATIGAGVGTASVLTQRGHDIRLSQGQQLRIRTNSDAEIQ